MNKDQFSEYLRQNKCKASFIALVLFLVISFLCIALSSCNVTRTITTTAEHYQRGDTTVTIMTKTVESYDGAVKRDNFLK